MYKLMPLSAALFLALTCCGKDPKPAPRSGGEPAPSPMANPDPPRASAPRVVNLPGAAAACKNDAARPGQSFSTKEYEVTVTAPAEASLGKVTQAVITITPKGGYKINLKYDHELALKRISSGIKPGRSAYGNDQAARRDKKGMKFVVKYTGSEAGKKVLQGVLDFSVCTPKQCMNKDDLCVSWESAVK